MGRRQPNHAARPQPTLVWLGDTDRAIILNEEGELILTRLNPEGHHEQSRSKIIGSTWAHPAFAGNRVYARSDTELVCVSHQEGAEESSIEAFQSRFGCHWRGGFARQCSSKEHWRPKAAASGTRAQRHRTGVRFTR